MRIHVVAGILQDANGCVLLSERLNDPQFPGLWEFPGGKIDGIEAPDAALRRELREELGIEISRFEPFLTIEHDYLHRQVRIEFFLVTEWRNELRAMLGQSLRWVPVEALSAQELLPANVAVIDALRRPTDASIQS